MKEEYPEIELWDEDASHPSMAGAYLARCITTYAVLYQKSSRGYLYTADLDENVAQKLQSVAEEFILK